MHNRRTGPSGYQMCISPCTPALGGPPTADSCPLPWFTPETLALGTMTPTVAQRRHRLFIFSNQLLRGSLSTHFKTRCALVHEFVPPIGVPNFCDADLSVRRRLVFPRIRCPRIWDTAFMTNVSECGGECKAGDCSTLIN